MPSLSNQCEKTNINGEIGPNFLWEFRKIDAESETGGKTKQNMEITTKWNFHFDDTLQFPFDLFTFCMKSVLSARLVFFAGCTKFNSRKQPIFSSYQQLIFSIFFLLFLLNVVVPVRFLGMEKSKFAFAWGVLIQFSPAVRIPIPFISGFVKRSSFLL